MGAQTDRIRFAARSRLKESLARLGLDVRRVHSSEQLRPVGDMAAFLEDLARRDLSVTDVLDVGANRGDWARLVSRVFPGCRVALIEPQVEMARYLDEFCRSHPGSVWVPVGAGAKDEELALTIWGDLVGSSFLPHEGSVRSDQEQRRVPVVTIDSLVSSNAIHVPQVVKLDVQGFELEVLKGAASLFGATEVFVIEASLVRSLPGQPRLDEVIAVMTANGYRVYDLAGFLRRPSDGALGQVDVCFAREDGPLCRSESW